MTTTFTPYPGFPADPHRAEEVRRRVAAIPRGLGFFARLDEDPEMVAVYKTDIVRGALENNATKPDGKRRPERAVIEHEEWVFETYAGI